ncbi:MAG: translocation/assembly module TamB domain-containing protein, partial [Candidatus Eremiobacteraeota bacterium]|nr:translocation/assembly module TamB domain-containing protein [Candidatus Eremiobacteraeota bacterium]
MSLSTGYHVQIGEMRLQSDHGALIDTHVSLGNEPVLDAQRIDLYYNLRALLPGSSHRFGLLGVTIDHPQITIVHHKDGTYNLKPIAPGSGGGPGRPTEVPLNFTLRVRDGSASVIDTYQYDKDARLQRLHNINVDLSVNTSARTHYTVSGAFIDVKDEPFHGRGTIDVVRGYALHHFEAASIPIKAIGNYIINSPAARILAGTAKHFDARIYALDLKPNQPIAYHVNAIADISDGQLFINGLAQPIESIAGRLQIFDGGLDVRQLEATLAGTPVRIAGAIYNFGDPKFELGVVGSGDLRALKNIVTFGVHQPLRGRAKLVVKVEGAIAKPLILIGMDSLQLWYHQIPLERISGLAALYSGEAEIVPLRLTYHGAEFVLRGRLALGSHIASHIAVHYQSPAASLPYLGAVVPNDIVAGEALLDGRDAAVGAQGYFASTNDPQNLYAFFNLDQNGVGSVGPLRIASGPGELIGGYAIDRPHNTSAFWVSASNLRFDQHLVQSFPGVALANIPPVHANIDDLQIAGGGSGSDVVAAGRAAVAQVQVSGIQIAAAQASFSGNLRDLAIHRVVADGPWGSIDGSGDLSPGRAIVRGTYAGTFDDLRPYTGDLGAHGSIHGPVAVAYAQNQLVIQAQNLHLGQATIRGVPIANISGTIGVHNGSLRVYAADASVAGGALLAAGGTGNVNFSATNVSAEQLRGLGLPLQSGVVSAVGTVGLDMKQPSFTGGVVVRDGRSSGFPVSGTANVAYAHNAVTLADGEVEVGTTYAGLSGLVAAVNSGAPQYALNADISGGNISQAAKTLRLPTYGTIGSFDANVAVGGSGKLPTIRGPVRVPVGSINGLGFAAGAAFISASPSGVQATGGHVLVGTTATAFSAASQSHRIAVSLRAPQADLSDFNDYFDTGDTLSGNGRVALAVVQSNALITTSGDVNIANFRYRRLPIGDTVARWSSRRNLVTGSVRIGGTQGILQTQGSIALAPRNQISEIFAGSTYHVSSRLSNLDLSTWLPALGYPTVPLTGRLNGTARIDGRYPRLAILGNVAMNGGTIGPVPITRFTATAKSSGGAISLSNFAFELPALSANGEGRFGLRPTDPLSLTIHAQTTDVPRLVAELTKRSIDVHAKVETTLQVGGSFHAPTFTGAFDANDANIYGLAIPSILGELALNGRNIDVRNVEVNFKSGRLALAGTLPLQLQPFAIGPSSAPISLDIDPNAVDLASFGALLGHNTKLAGILDGNVNISGSVGSPRIAGELNVKRGEYQSDFERAPITNTVARLAFAQTSATLETLSATLGRGSLRGAGTIDFPTNRPTTYSLHAVTNSAALNFPAFGEGLLDSNLRLVRKATGLALLSGRAKIVNAIIPFSALYRPNTDGSTAAAASLPFNLAFNLAITAGRNVRVRGGGIGAGLDIGGEGQAQLAGTLAAPTLKGQINSTGGTLTYVDRSFKVQQGTVSFDPVNGVIPDLHAVGVTHVQNPDPDPQRNPTGSADITIKVDGPITAPTISFESNPPGYSRSE